MLRREEAERDSFIGELLEPVQFFYGRSGQHPGKPILVAEGGYIKRLCANETQAVLVQVVIMAVRDENDLGARELTRGQRKGGVTGEEGPGISENGVGKDIPVLEMDPERRMSQVGDGVPPSQNLSYRWTNHGELWWIALGRGIRVGAEHPFQESSEPHPLISLGPGIGEAGFLVMSLSPGKVLEVRLIE